MSKKQGFYSSVFVIEEELVFSRKICLVENFLQIDKTSYFLLLEKNGNGTIILKKKLKEKFEP